MAAAPRPDALASVLTRARRKGAALLYWENQKESAAALTVGLLWFVLIGVVGYSSITVVCYWALFQLAARLVYRVLSDLVDKRVEVEPPEVFISEDDVVQSAKAATALINSTLRAAYMLVFCNYNKGTVFKSMVGLWILAIASKVLGTTGVCFVAFASAFSLPKLYQLYQPHIDRVLGEVATRVAHSFEQLSLAIRDQLTQLYEKLASMKKGTATKDKHH